MKDGVRVINCARGGLVVEADLKEALDSGKVAGAALDVFEVEPARDNSLFGHPNLVCTPHLGASTTEAQEKVALQVAEQMSDYLMTGAVTNALNMPSVTAEEAPLLRPYMKLSEQIGSFLGQIADSAINSVRIEYEGDVADLNTKPLTANAMAGLLRPQLEQINVVSAPIVAQDRGIDISETKREQCRDFHARIRMEVRSDKATWSVAGTVFAGDLPRIVSVEEVPIEAEIYTDMLFVRNIDQPGLIGAVGTALGNAGVNIASFHLGRVGGSGTAVALVAVDAEIPHSVIKEVAALPNVDRVKALKFT
jgi:D-3-phosphoglycerate dehydrogenase